MTQTLKVPRIRCPVNARRHCINISVIIVCKSREISQCRCIRFSLNLRHSVSLGIWTFLYKLYSQMKLILKNNGPEISCFLGQGNDINRATYMYYNLIKAGGYSKKRTHQGSHKCQARKLFSPWIWWRLHFLMHCCLRMCNPIQLRISCSVQHKTVLSLYLKMKDFDTFDTACITSKFQKYCITNYTSWIPMWIHRCIGEVRISDSMQIIRIVRFKQVTRYTHAFT